MLREVAAWRPMRSPQDRRSSESVPQGSPRCRQFVAGQARSTTGAAISTAPRPLVDAWCEPAARCDGPHHRQRAKLAQSTLDTTRPRRLRVPRSHAHACELRARRPEAPEAPSTRWSGSSRPPKPLLAPTSAQADDGPTRPRPTPLRGTSRALVEQRPTRFVATPARRLSPNQKVCRVLSVHDEPLPDPRPAGAPPQTLGSCPYRPVYPEPA